MLIKRNKALSRRTLLKTMGTAIALPWLEAMLPSDAHAAETPLRFIGYYTPCGFNLDQWRPTQFGAGDAWQLSNSLAPLVNVKEKINVISGLNNWPAVRPGGDHAAGTSAFMTCQRINDSQTAIRNDISVDQMIAQSITNPPNYRSLQLGIETPAPCDLSYSCAYTHNVSWASATQPLPKIIDPLVVFNQLFQGASSTETQAEQFIRQQMKLSVLDSVLEETNTLRQQLGQSDRAKLDEYLTGLRELEQRIGNDQSTIECSIIDAPAENLDINDTIQAMTDLMVLALQCDQTRVISFMLGDGFSNRTHEFIGVSGSHHELSHHQDDAANLEALALIDHWEMQKFALLLEQLDNVLEGDGTLLDHTLVYMSSEIGDGDSHSHGDMPIILAGGAGGALQTNRNIAFNSVPLANMFIAMLEVYGIQIETFGEDGSGPLAGLFNS